MFDCSQLPGHVRAICEGTHKKATGKTHTLAERREIIGRYLRIDASQIELPMPAAATRVQSDIGTRLHAIIERDAGAKIECSDCRDEVTKLNLLTAEQVQEKRESIAIGIVERGKTKAPKFWQRWGAKLAPRKAKQQALSWIDEACSVVDTNSVAEIPAPHRNSDTDEAIICRTEVIVKSFRRFPALVRLVRSIRKQYPTLRIRIVDDSHADGSMSDALQYLQSLDAVSVHIAPFDSGLPAGRNLGVQKSAADFVIICDDDFVFTSQTNIVAMLNPIEKDHADICGGLVRMDGKKAENWCGEFSWNGDQNGKRNLILKPLSTRTQTIDGYSFRRSDITFNFFAARRETLLNNPYDEQYKITSEHLDSFLTWHEKDVPLRVSYTTDCIAGHLHYSTQDYKTFRRRDHAPLLLKKWNIEKRNMTGRTGFPELKGPTVESECVMADKPNVVILTIGRSGSSILANMMLRAGWLCPSADSEFGEHVGMREINRKAVAGRGFDAQAAEQIANGLPEPWMLKDPRLTWTLKDWIPLLERYKPKLLFITRNIDAVEKSFRKQNWGGESPRGYEFAGVTLEKQLQWCQAYFDSWKWGKLHVEYEQLHAALALFDTLRGS